MRLHKYFFLTSVALAISMSANATLLQTATEYLPYGTQVAFLAQPVGAAKPIIEKNAKQMMLPASTQKIVTALAASLFLGSKYQYVTTLESTGTIQKNTLSGDLVVRFNGDPTLTRKNLEALVNTLVNKGVKTIAGNVIIDSSAFSGHDKAMGWSWNNISACYNTPPTAAMIDGNCFTATVNPSTSVSKPATVSVTENVPIRITSEAITIPAKSDNKYCELDVITQPNNGYLLTGCIKQNQKNMRLTFAVQDGVSFAKMIIPQILREKGIRVTGKVKSNEPIYKPLSVLAEHYSAPLPALLTTMLKNSHNQIADSLFRTMGREHFGVGSWRAGEDAVKAILLKYAKIDLQNTTLKDGSGLSRQDAITAEKLMEILQYIAKNDKKLQLIEKLPISGKDGTLANRKSLKEKDLIGTIHAKTGYLDGSYNLAGFITTQHGKQIAFVQFMSGYSPQNIAGNYRQAAMQFETELYRSLYSD